MWSPLTSDGVSGFLVSSVIGFPLQSWRINEETSLIAMSSVYLSITLVNHYQVPDTW